MQRFFFFAAVVLLAIAPAGATKPAQGLNDVSLIQLIANPDKYHHKRVRVVGYLHVKFEDSAIYLGKDDADYLNGKNGLWVSYAAKSVSREAPRRGTCSRRPPPLPSSRGAPSPRTFLDG